MDLIMFFFGRNDFDKTFGEGTQLQSFVAQLQILAEVYDSKHGPSHKICLFPPIAIL
jgi:hypothetical protein|tara:strand:+ start:406 stop:576 length:171 start_codon:yes stop_codon:yes gene_type:complete